MHVSIGAASVRAPTKVHRSVARNGETTRVWAGGNMANAKQIQASVRPVNVPSSNTAPHPFATIVVSSIFYRPPS